MGLLAASGVLPEFCRSGFGNGCGTGDGVDGFAYQRFPVPFEVVPDRYDGVRHGDWKESPFLRVEDEREPDSLVEQGEQPRELVLVSGEPYLCYGDCGDYPGEVLHDSIPSGSKKDPIGYVRVAFFTVLLANPSVSSPAGGNRNLRFRTSILRISCRESIQKTIPEVRS